MSDGQDVIVLHRDHGDSVVSADGLCAAAGLFQSPARGGPSGPHGGAQFLGQTEGQFIRNPEAGGDEVLLCQM